MIATAQAIQLRVLFTLARFSVTAVLAVGVRTQVANLATENQASILFLCQEFPINFISQASSFYALTLLLF